MKGIVKKLLKVMRTFLARIGVPSWTSSSREGHRVKHNQSVPSPLNDVREQRETCKAENPQSIEPCFENRLSAPVYEEADLATKHEVMDDAVATLEQSPTPVELDVSKVPALDTASRQEPKSNDVSLGIKKTPVVDDVDFNSDLSVHEFEEKTPASGENAIESQTEMRLNSGDAHEALGEPALDQSNEATMGQSSNNEIKTQTTLTQKLLGSSSDKDKGDMASTSPEDYYAGSSGSDNEEAHHIKQQNPCPDPPQKDEIHPAQAKEDIPTSTSEPNFIDADLEAKTPLDVGPENQQGRQAYFSAGAVPVPEDRQVAQEAKDQSFLVPEQEITTASGVEGPHPRDIPLQRPTPPESTDEYKAVVPDLSAVDQEYARWNRVIIEELLLARSSEKSMYLCVNPRILAKIYGEAGFDLLTPDQAEQQFSAATAQIYQKRVLKNGKSLRILRRYGDDGSPDCVAFLAASVLAAYHMRADIEVSSNAYYGRLADLLDCEVQRSHPIGFKPAVFESLWVFLHDWLHKTHEKQLAMPKDRSELRRFIALPLAHVPLRSLDIEKLPAFFKWAKYCPGGRIRHAQLLAALQKWQQSRHILTPTGARALSDDRSDAVLAQVSAELESWDGNLSESGSRHSALVEIHLDIIQRSPVLSYLPKRHPGFPEVFENEDCVFKASGEGWYDRTEISVADGDLLESGFEWHSRVNGTKFTLRRPKASVVVLVPSDDSGFLSSNHLLRGVKCAVLCREEVIDKVQEYISKVAQQNMEAKAHSKLPKGWLIIRDIKALVHIETPAGLEVLTVDQNITFTITGGFRIGRQWSWLAGSPPQVLVSGVNTSDQVKINSIPVKIGANGELLADRVLDKPGMYLIEAGSSRRKIEIVKPSISTQPLTKEKTDADANQNFRVALPQGSWKLLGRSPDQISHFQDEFLQGILASCPFHPVWAIQVGTGPGVRVAALIKPVPPIKLDHPRRKGRIPYLFALWTTVIYEAQIRRPSFIRMNGIIPDENVKLAWKQYVTEAKQIKRMLKERK